MSWATQRQLLIILGILILIAIPVSYFGYKIFYHAPTCTDLKQNQNEEGIDCGGNCALLCQDQIGELITLWDPRLFKVVDGFYTTVVSIENPNFDAGAENVPYVFKVYNTEGIVIAERKGLTRIPPNHSFPIIETGLTVGERIPARVTFEFTAVPVWKKMPREESPLVIENKEIFNASTTPRITATVRNSSLESFKNIEIIAVVFDAENNAMGASKTLIESLPKESIKDIVFTWPEAFLAPVVRIDIVPKI